MRAGEQHLAPAGVEDVEQLRGALADAWNRTLDWFTRHLGAH